MPSELSEQLTAADLAAYMAMVEIDGPFWGEREAAYLRQLSSVQAAAGGAAIPADDFRLAWSLGAGETEGANLLDPHDGLELFAARHGIDVREVV